MMKPIPGMIEYICMNNLFLVSLLSSLGAKLLKTICTSVIDVVTNPNSPIEKFIASK